MITKAIIESIIDRYTVKVRIPRIDRIPSSSIHTDSALLNEAIICTLPNCDPNLRIGDVVFIANDDQNEDEIIVLGHLYREALSNTYCDFILNELQVQQKVKLPQECSIGDINYKELKTLIGIKDNIQKQLDSLLERINIIESNYATTSTGSEE